MKSNIQKGKENAKLMNNNIIARFPKVTIHYVDHNTKHHITISTILRFKYKRTYWCTIVRKSYWIDKDDFLNWLSNIINAFNEDIEIVKNLTIPDADFKSHFDEPLFWIEEEQRSDKEIYQKKIEKLYNIYNGTK